MISASGWFDVTDDMRSGNNADFPLVGNKMQIIFDGKVYDAHLMIESYTKDGYQYGWYNDKHIRITGIQDGRVTAWRYKKERCCNG